MYKDMLLIFLSLGIHSHFVPLKITSHSQCNNVSTIVKEIISLLNRVTDKFNGITFTTPTNLTCLSCSHDYTEEFIQELKKIENPSRNNTHDLISRVELQMKELENVCPVLKKSRGKHSSCKTSRTSFNRFKEELEEFVSWINEKNICYKT